jgi:hypothetical protein
MSRRVSSCYLNGRIRNMASIEKLSMAHLLFLLRDNLGLGLLVNQPGLVQIQCGYPQPDYNRGDR